MKREELIKSCSYLLYKLCDLVESRNSLNYYDINISSEYFFIPLLNQVFDCDLHNMNATKNNAEAIDLYDVNGKVSVQVTSDSSAEKIRATLRKYRKKKLYEKYNRLIIMVITREHNYRADFDKDINGEFNFSKSKDIITIKSLVKIISDFNPEKITNIYEYLEYQLDTVFDKNQVEPISQAFDYISQNTNNILNESFFEIDSDIFISEFNKKLDTSTVIHVSSVSPEEGKYCILNLLHKEKPDSQVYIIKSKESWNKADKYFRGCILIPEFKAEEIPASHKNKTIFIQNDNDHQNALRLPRRTISFLSHKLKANGCDNPDRLLQKTHGLYYFIKRELFIGEISCPNWEKDNNNAVIVATLLGNWTECDGDKSVIERLYGGSYANFMTYLSKYIDIDEALIVRRYSMAYKLSYELANPLLAVCSKISITNLPILDNFLDIANSVLSDRDPLFDEPFEKHYYLAALQKQNYSRSIKSGISRTLIMLALYADSQEKISAFIKNLLMAIDSVNDWAYMSQFIVSLCEASPDAVMSCLEKNLDNHTGLLDLFIVEKSDFLLESHYYTDVLWCIEKLLKCQDCAIRAVSILFKLGSKVDKCSMGNSPRGDLSRVFCTWYNVSALSVEEKIELAKMGVEKYPYFWDILYNEINNKSSLCDFSSFTYRAVDEIVQYTRANKLNFIDSYTDTLVSNVGDSLERLIKVLGLLPNCSYKQFVSIKNEISAFVENREDPDREQIKTELRKIIFHHRRFANSEWSAPPEIILQIEEICKGITFDDPAYDYLYLTESGEIPILNPVAYDSKSDYSQNKNVIDNAIKSEMIKIKESGIDLGHYLGLREISNTMIGKAIAEYYCNSNYDERILETIICSTDNAQIAVNYIWHCTGAIYKALEYLQIHHYADKFYVAVLLSLPFTEKTKPYVNALPDEEKNKYWSNFSIPQFDSRDLLIEVIENLLSFENWHGLYYAMISNESSLSTEEIITIISASAEKMIERKHPIDANENYLIQNLFDAVYQRIGDDFESYPILFGLEMQLFNVIGWNNLKCLQYYVKHYANYYADILSIIYIRRDDGSSLETMESDRMMNLYKLDMEMKFCPGEEGGKINRDVLNEWINTFRVRLGNNNLLSLFYRKLGKLFAFSPEGTDGIFPHEAIRDKIEELGNEELINAFVIAIINERGIYTPNGGKAERNLGEKYKKIGKSLEIRYPKTARIFNILSEHYFDESNRERKIAESDIYG